VFFVFFSICVFYYVSLYNYVGFTIPPGMSEGLNKCCCVFYQSSNLVDRTAAARQMHTTCLVVTRKVHSILPFNFLAESQFASNFYRERQK